MLISDIEAGLGCTVAVDWEDGEWVVWATESASLNGRHGPVRGDIVAKGETYESAIDEAHKVAVEWAS